MISTKIPGRPARVALALGTAAALVVTGTADASAATAPKPFRGTSIVVQKSIGGVALGASTAATEKLFGASHCSAADGCNYAAPHSSYTVYAGFDSSSKKVTTVIFQSLSLASSARKLHTNRKIGIGSTYTQLKKAYSKIKKTVGPGVGVHYYSLGTSHTGTRFALNSKNKVYEIDLFSS